MGTRCVFHGDFEITGQFLQNFGYWAPPRKPHTGVDLVGKTDHVVHSPVDGSVEYAGNSGDGFGNYVRIKAANGREHYLCHLASIAVKAGKTVSVGDTIGIMGATGNVTGPHTHYEIRNPKGSGYDLESGPDFMGVPNKQGTYSSDKYPAGTVTTPATAPTGNTYTVKAGDTLSGIAQKYGTTYQQIAAANGITNPSLIHPGQVLKITGAQPITTPTVKLKPGTWNLRSGPSTGNSVIAVIQGSASYPLHGTTAGGWMNITAAGHTGFVGPASKA